MFLSTVWNRGATVIQSLTRQPFAHFPVQIANQDSFKQQLSGTGSDRPGRGVLHHMWVMEVLSSPGLKSILWCAQTLLITTPLLQTCRTRLSCLIVWWTKSEVTPIIKKKSRVFFSFFVFKYIFYSVLFFLCLQHLYLIGWIIYSFLSFFQGLF